MCIRLFCLFHYVCLTAFLLFYLLVMSSPTEPLAMHRRAQGLQGAPVRKHCLTLAVICYVIKIYYYLINYLFLLFFVGILLKVINPNLCTFKSVYHVKPHDEVGGWTISGRYPHVFRRPTYTIHISKYKGQWSLLIDSYTCSYMASGYTLHVRNHKGQIGQY